MGYYTVDGLKKNDGTTATTTDDNNDSSTVTSTTCKHPRTKVCVPMAVLVQFQMSVLVRQALRFAEPVSP